MDFDGIFTKKLENPINPCPTRDTLGNAESAISNTFILIVGSKKVSVPFHHGYDWNMDFGAGGNSIRLWLFSLPMIFDLCNAYKHSRDEKYLHKAVEIFHAWNSFTKVPENWAMMFEQEHAVANRSCAIVYLIQTLNDSKMIVPDGDRKEIIESLIEHGWWLHNDEHYVYNNHGVMMDRALMQLALLFTAERFLYDEWKTKSISRIKMMLSKTFGRDGLSVENSPSYHILNTNLFSIINDYIKTNRLDLTFQQETGEILEKAIQALPYMVRDDKRTPPVGDSEVVEYQYIQQIRDSAYFTDAGYAVVNEYPLFATLKCGFTGYVHKHIDDDSLTLRYSGKDIIVDGGMYSFDINDKDRRYFISWRAHSGLFTSDFEKLLFKDFSGTEPSSIAGINFFSKSHNSIRINCYNHFIKDTVLKRELIFVKPNALIIKDSAIGSEKKEVFQQFLLHPDAELSVTGNEVTGKIGDVKFLIRQFIDDGLSMRQVPSLYSEKFLDKRDCSCIRYRKEGAAVEFLTIIECHSGQPGEVFDLNPSLLATEHVINYFRRDQTSISDLVERKVDPKNFVSLASQISIEPEADGLIVNVGDSAQGYIQLFDGAFEKPSEKKLNESMIPKGASKVTLKMRLINDTDDKVTVTPFIMQYDENKRIENYSKMIVTSARDALIDIPCDISSKAISIKIAIKFSGFRGKINLIDMKMIFE
ncbi:MAG: heparinase II/III family protein [Methanomassiliicoccales archaeon]